MTTDALDLMPAELISEMPRLYDQDGKGKDAIVHAHLFGPVGDFYLTEVDAEGEVGFGYTMLSAHPDGAELGYIHLSELQGVVSTFKQTKDLRYLIERDLHWTPCPLKEVMA